MPRRIALALLTLIVLAGALLRLDAFVGGYGTLMRPAWARAATQDIAPLARYLRPSAVAWAPIASPYVGGDPINYLKFAREFTTFYQPHVREPVFLALTAVSLAALGDQDAGVSLASIIGSLLLIVGAYLLGTEVVSRAAGLALAFVMAFDYELITWSRDGWRDDTFAAAVAFAAWAFVRFHKRATFGNALLVGVTTGLACLTRITALSFVLPALALVAMSGGGPARPRREYTAVALLVLAAVVGPFLLSCAIATGDPFYAINYHTAYYRYAEGMPSAQPASVGAYLRAKFAAHPLQMLDTGITGEFVRPFAQKWVGLRLWGAWLPPLGIWAGLAGLLMMPFTSGGRLLLVILLGSLLPYAFTWNVGGGGEWRFTMPAYPFYVLAAAIAVAATMSFARMLVSRPASWRARVTVVAMRAAVVSILAAAAAFVYNALPWYVTAEAVGKGESVSIETGGRDGWFFRSGWSAPHTEGIATVRVSTAGRATVQFPLPRRRPCDVILRLDPAAPDGQAITVLFNQQMVLRTALAFDPQRVGAYHVHLPVEWMHPGANELVIVPAPTLPAGAAGPRFGWLPPHQAIGVRLWFVRVVPLT